MNKNFQKKGAVEMSLNLIIMLIIGMVVLGLVIGFVNNLVSQGAKGFDDQLGDNEKLKLDELRSCPDVFCFNPSPSVKVKKGDKTNVFLKVRNVGSSALSISPGEQSSVLVQSSTHEDGASTSEFQISGPGFELDPGKEDAQMYTLRVGDSTALGTHYVTFGVAVDSEIFKEVITVQVE